MERTFQHHPSHPTPPGPGHEIALGRIDDMVLTGGDQKQRDSSLAVVIHQRCDSLAHQRDQRCDRSLVIRLFDLAFLGDVGPDPGHGLDALLDEFLERNEDLIGLRGARRVDRYDPVQIGVAGRKPQRERSSHRQARHDHLRAPALKPLERRLGRCRPVRPTRRDHVGHRGPVSGQKRHLDVETRFGEGIRKRDHRGRMAGESVENERTPGSGGVGKIGGHGSVLAAASPSPVPLDLVDLITGPWFTDPVTRRADSRVRSRQLASSSASRARRRVDPAAWWAFAPVVALTPLWLVSLIPVWLVLDLAIGVAFWVLALIYLSAGSLLFVRPAQRLVLAPLLQVRAPSESETARILSAWEPVAQAHGIRDGRFLFAVVDQDELNAFACGGHFLVISSLAVTELDRDELSGVLAHELAHHLGSHTVAVTVTQWMSLPVLAVAHLGWWLRTVAEAATHTFARRGSLVETVGQLTVHLLRAVSAVLIAGVQVASIVGNIAGRGAEFAADRRAWEMGFGGQLARALRRHGTSQSSLGSRWARLTRSHPPSRTRAARLEAFTRHGPGGIEPEGRHGVATRQA